MIRGFRDKKTEKLFAGETVREFSGFAKIAERKLTMLDNASEVMDLLSPPGNRLERLKGNGTGNTVSGLMTNGGCVLCGKMTERMR